MKKIVNEMPSFGVFSLNPKNTQQVVDYLKNQGYVILLLEGCNQLKQDPILISHRRKQVWDDVQAILITISNQGMQNFKRHFHRSMTYVSNRNISKKDMNMLLNDENELTPYSSIIKYYMMETHFQIKIMREIYLRDEVVVDNIEIVRILGEKNKKL